MRVVVIGKGGREHALAQKLKTSKMVTELWVCPGNPGMIKSGIPCVSIEKPAEIETFCKEQKVSLVVVGPEAAILSDLKERLATAGVFCFAPSPEVARLESSKIFCKEILLEAGVRTAKSTVGHTDAEIITEINKHDFLKPLVLKADGLAQGKGVWVCENKEKAIEATRILTQQFGFPILIEECLLGKELSAFALCDGTDFVILGTACDYKRITPDPFSANTGGMGAYSPCDFISLDDERELNHIFKNTLQTLNSKGLPYQGFLFAGLMKTTEGLYVLEYNVRMGDPETQALLPRIESDFCELILAAVKHELAGKSCTLSDESSVHVVAVSKGYPQAQMNLGNPIMISGQIASDVHLYFAGVSGEGDKLLNSGGRVLGVTALAGQRGQAREKAYADLRKIHYEGMYFREDIGQ